MKRSWLGTVLFEMLSWKEDIKSSSSMKQEFFVSRSFYFACSDTGGWKLVLVGTVCLLIFYYVLNNNNIEGNLRLNGGTELERERETLGDTERHWETQGERQRNTILYLFRTMASKWFWLHKSLENRDLHSQFSLFFFVFTLPPPSPSLPSQSLIWSHCSNRTKMMNSITVAKCTDCHRIQHCNLLAYKQPYRIVFFPSFWLTPSANIQHDKFIIPRKKETIR